MADERKQLGMYGLDDERLRVWRKAWDRVRELEGQMFGTLETIPKAEAASEELRDWIERHQVILMVAGVEHLATELARAIEHPDSFLTAAAYRREERILSLDAHDQRELRKKERAQRRKEQEREAATHAKEQAKTRKTLKGQFAVIHSDDE